MLKIMVERKLLLYIKCPVWCIHYFSFFSGPWECSRCHQEHWGKESGGNVVSELCDVLLDRERLVYNFCCKGEWIVLVKLMYLKASCVCLQHY